MNVDMVTCDSRATHAEKKYGVPAREILVERGRRGCVGGRENMIEDTALTLSEQKQTAEMGSRQVA